LEKKGCLRCDKNRSRAIEIIGMGDEELVGASDSSSDLTDIPRLGVVAAGLPIMAEENWDGTIPFPASQLRPGSYFALEVKGQSMLHAGIMDGDTAIIRQQTVAANGDIVVAMVDDSVTIKRYFKEQNRVRLKAENPEFPSIYSSEVRILGVLAHLIRHYPA
jgi:repressor LexA